MNNALILLSGGLDSVVSLAVSRDKFDKIIALTFNYGQKSLKAEINASKNISDFYNINHRIINIDWLKNISNSSLNTEDRIPVISKEDLDNIEKTQKTADCVWVPNRNGLFVNIAACFADALGYSSIIIGANKEEGRTFKDNSSEFISAVNKSLLNSTNNKVQLIAPLINLTKEDIVRKGIELNIPFNMIYSCYLGKKKHCGRCESCLRLMRSLELNNRHDIIKNIFG